MAGRGTVLAAATATVGLLLFAAVLVGSEPPGDLHGRRADANVDEGIDSAPIPRHFPTPAVSSAASSEVTDARDDFTLPPLALGDPYDARRGPPRRFVTPLPEDGVRASTSSATPSPRRVWIDCGARGKYGSATVWFMKRNPEASTFHARLFDPIGKGGEYDAATRAFFRSFEYRAAAVAGALPQGAVEGALAMRGRRMMAPALAEAGLSDSGSGDIATTTVPAVDFAAWLQARYTEADFVVVKMDIEGGEWEVLAHLIRTGAIRLIDELMLECHRPAPRWRVMQEFWASVRLDTAHGGPPKVPVATCGALFHLLSNRNGHPAARINCTTAGSPCLRRVHRWL